MSSKNSHVHPFTFLLLVSLILNAALFLRDYRRSIVTHVVDGDTLQLADNRRVRLRSIDAPEKNRCMAQEARQFLEKQVLNRHIRVKDQLIDEYGRIVAVAIVEDFRGWIGYMTKRFDPLLNRSMLAHGFARYFSSGTQYDPMLKKAAETAKKNNWGIYSEECRSATPTTECTIKGNIRSGVKTYYLPSCRDYDQVIIDTSFGDQWFCSEKEAIDAGFIRSKRCAKIALSSILR